MQKLIAMIERWRSTLEMEQKGLLGSRKRRTDSYLLAKADSSRVITIFLLVFLAAAIFIMMNLASGAKIEDDWSKYTVAPQTVINELPGDFKYVDMEKWQEDIAASIADAPVYLYPDMEVQTKIVEDFKKYAAAPEEEVHENDTEGVLHVPQIAKVLLATPNLRNRLLVKLDALLKTGIVSEDVLSQYSAETDFYLYSGSGVNKRLAVNFIRPASAARLLAEDAAAFAGNSDLQENEIIILQEEFQKLIGKGNFFLDSDRTQIEQEKIRDAVVPPYCTVKRGEVIVFAGEELKPNMIEIYKQYASNYNSVNHDRTGEFARTALFAILLVSFVALFLYHLYPQVLYSNKSMLLLVTILTVTLAINLAYLAVSRDVSAKVGMPVDYFFSIVPVPLAAMLLGVTMGLRLAMCGGFLVAVVTSQMMDMELRQALLALVTCTLASLAVRSSTNYRSLFLRCAGMFAACWILDGDIIKMLLMPWNDLENLKNMLIIATVSSVSAAMLVLPLVFILELVFNVSTNMSLLVLCDLNNPLLRQLQMLAPGTSMHSQNVAILAEAAAEAIGANPLKARAAALYHDIGKIMNPEYFTENNIETANMHTSLSPRMSSMIILNHVKDGLDLAIKFKLCRIVRDAISQHHGTDLLHFYRLARENDENGNIPFEKDYRYPGPLPRDPEIVLVSLADASEAYCKSLQKPTASKIEAAVNEIFQTRLKNGQLDNAELTVAKLAAAKESFVRTLITMYHSRIAYRKEEEENESDVHVEKSEAAASGEETADQNVPQSS